MSTPAMCRAVLPLAAMLLALGCGSDEEVNAHDVPPATLDVPADHPYAGPTLAEFELLECRGETVTSADLAGRPFVLDFIFTTCAGPCPTMSASMSRLQDELAGTSAMLVSVSVDPGTDDAATLRTYADTYGADPERWWFLTGDEAGMGELAASVYLAVVPVDGDDTDDAVLGYQVAHATKFVVVDGNGVVRGYYDGQTEDGVLAAAARVRFLESER